MLEDKMETGEEIFNKYSAPCRETLFNQGNISAEQYEKSKEFQRKTQTPPREFLEELHPKAVEDMKEFAEICKKNMWDAKQMRNFWINYHNIKVDQTNSPEHAKEECKVYIARVLQTIRINFITKYTIQTILPNKKETIAIGNIDANPNDHITIHKKTAIEKI